jgi:nucleoside 2-deoxyribosyltransferase
MKLFCSNAFTGEDFNQVSARMQMVVEALNNAGHEAYCPVFDPHKIELQSKGDTRAIFEYAFENISKCDGMVAIISSDRKSEGQLMEIGATLAQKKPLFVFVHKSAAAVPSHMLKLATKTFTWTTNEELVQTLAQI